MAKKRHLRVLFIGNSHTYYHSLPEWFARMASEDGYECDVTMLAHPGWYLHQHVKEPEVRFNIEYGHYDYVVLQEHSHPFDDIPGYIEAATTLAGWIREAGSRSKCMMKMGLMRLKVELNLLRRLYGAL